MSRRALIRDGLPMLSALRPGTQLESMALGVRLKLRPLADLKGRIPPNNVGTDRIGLLDHAS
ncbi:hypothetical protein D9M73_146170 [compost metagenome]